MSIPAVVSRVFSSARILGNGDDRVALSETEMMRLLEQCCQELALPRSISNLPEPSLTPPSSEYFRVPLDWFSTASPTVPSSGELLSSLAACMRHTPDFGLYFSNLAALHKRRVKYRRILSRQPKPTMDQVGPRSLLEFGTMEDELLSSWLIWRKWFYDVDNRAAQETGYLFEPVLASCLGGQAVGAQNSPIKRLDESGKPTSDGRQIDCYDGVANVAYEFKLRVTIAASGQGRFGEELSFPRECRAAGLIPRLVVLDPTRSSRLEELVGAFRAQDGECFVGPEAWAHMDDKAGPTMAGFLERYIRPPLTRMAQFDNRLPQSLTLDWNAETISLSGCAQSLVVRRHAPLPT